MQFLTGYKTYVTAAIVVLVAAIESFGIDIPNWEMTLPEAISVAVAIVFARNGGIQEARKVERRITADTDRGL